MQEQAALELGLLRVSFRAKRRDGCVEGLVTPVFCKCMRNTHKKINIQSLKHSVSIGVTPIKY